MAQLHTGCVSAEDVLAMFLDDMNAFEPTLLDGNESVNQASQARKGKTTCARQRDQLLAIRSEAASLQHQLRILHENHDLRKSLDLLMNTHSSSAKNDVKKWKFRAMRERSRKQHAELQNMHLRQRVATNAKFLRQVATLVNKQELKARRCNLPFVSLSDVSTRVFSALRARLDARWSQVATIEPQSVHASSSAIVLASRAAKGSWAMFSSSHEVSMVFDGSFAAPFDSTLVCGVVGRFTLLHGFEVPAETYVDKMAQFSEPNRMQLRDGVSSGIESNRRVILRRIHDARGTILLWEGTAHWQLSAQPDQQAAMDDSGWAFIAAQSQEVSIVRHGGSVQIRAPDDEAGLDPRDTLVTGIVRAVKARNAHMESLFMDLFLEEARQQSM